MKFSGRFKSRPEANVGIGGCASPQPDDKPSRTMFSRAFCCQALDLNLFTTSSAGHGVSSGA